MPCCFSSYILSSILDRLDKQLEVEFKEILKRDQCPVEFKDISKEDQRQVELQDILKGDQLQVEFW